MLIERAQLLDLSAPEMTALVGGLRAIGANYDSSDHGVFTDRVGVLHNDFFVNLLDVCTEWLPADHSNQTFEGKDSRSNEHKWTASRSDLVFGSHLQLRAVSDVFGTKNGGYERFVKTFVKAWHKVMMSDRFELENDHYTV